jgi:hypothetical protein
LCERRKNVTELQTKPAPHPTAAPCATATCGPIALERNLFFTGKLLTARDFRDETAYLRSRIHLHNRLFVGTGVVCGLRIVEHDLPDCRSRWVIVRAGLAIDCCGREVVLSEDTRLQIVEDSSPDSTDEPCEFVVCIRYREQEIECVPVLDDSCACTSPGFHASRVREVGELHVLPLDETYPEGCWPRQSTEAECRGCDDPEEALAGCLEADCDCGECVPIGIVVVRGCEPIEIVDEHPPGPGRAGASLTHVTGYSWPHGGDLELGQLAGPQNGELRITFDRKLLPAESAESGTGINLATFVVQYAQSQADLEYLEPAEGYPCLDETGCTAIFRLPEERLRRTDGRYGRDSLTPGTRMLVTLRCDFLLDCRGQPVDGNHLGGRVPTGNRVAGGTFESWFTLVEGGTW